MSVERSFVTLLWWGVQPDNICNVLSDFALDGLIKHSRYELHSNSKAIGQ